jgi:predicted protein tyrosine phosphatase
MTLLRHDGETDTAYVLRTDAARREALLASGYTGLDVVVMSQFEARRYEPGLDDVCISIWSKAWSDGPPKLSRRFVEVLTLEFDDVDYTDRGTEGAVTISDADADRVIDFVRRHRGRKTLVVHCFAGVSRSRTVAATLGRLFGVMDGVYTGRSPTLAQQLEEAYERQGGVSATPAGSQ